jgi:uncharacterized protein YaaQ
MVLRIGGSSMKLLIAVVNDDDAYSLIDVLTDVKYGATLVSTTGGFLRQGNSTLLIGVDDERLADVLRIIKDTCHSRTMYLNAFPTPSRPMEALASVPMQVQVGRAVLFALDVERFFRF